jgi:hypothetical protein
MREVAKPRDPKVISLGAGKLYWWKTKFGLCPEMQEKNPLEDTRQNVL